jgi:hypothetical protein
MKKNFVVNRSQMPPTLELEENYKDVIICSNKFIYIYNIAFVNSERYKLAKSRVDITRYTERGNFPSLLDSILIIIFSLFIS